MYYETLDVSGEASSLLATTWYYYNASGNPTRIVTKPEASTQYSATRLGYAKNGETVTYVLGETWEADGADPDNCPENYDITFAREFRYDSGRARYLNRELDVSTTTGLMHNPPIFSALTETWTDYDDDGVYDDFSVAGEQITQLAIFEPDIAERVGSATFYEHGDMVGTRRRQSNPSSAPIAGVTYTAFGERIDGTNHRYGYAGTWGYQAHAQFPFLHVGARYYEPKTGRFLQRDPIGIYGGRNVYTYVRNRPTDLIDPLGLVWGMRPSVTPQHRVHPPPSGRPNSPESPPGGVLIKGRPRWYDPFAAAGCSLIGINYYVDRRPPRPGPDYWYCIRCDRWAPNHESHLHPGTP
jgi:RHS repeat-associated protein